MYVGVISVIIIAVASYGLFFFFQRVNEKSIRESIFEQELERQINSTTKDGIIYIAPFYGFQNKIPKDIQVKFIQLSQDIRNKKIIVSE